MAGGKRSGSGRKSVNINLAELEKLCGLQCTDEEVASFFSVSVRTIERRKRQPAFGEAMARGKARGRLSLRRSLWGLAAQGNPAANIFLSKNLLGYKDVQSNEHSGRGEDRPELQEFEHPLVVSALSAIPSDLLRQAC